VTARRAAWSILAVAALWACADTVGPGLYHARLSIYPVFADASLLGGAGSDVDSFLVRISNPPLPDVDTTVVIPAGEDEITLTLNVPVSSALDTVTVLFRGYSSATGQLLYQGSQDVTVRPGVPTGSVPVQASYVGPGAGIDSLVLAPSAATVAPLATTQLDYTGYQGALALPDDSVPVRWVSTDTAIATVSGTGLVTGRTNGSVRIICVSVARSSVRDTAALTVGTIVQPAIGLSPSSVVFVAAAGGSPPAAQPVAVTNAGGQTLSGIALGTVSYGSGATGWLTASLSGAAAPATLTLQPSLVPSAAGSYTASVPVTASGATNSPQTVTVTYTVTGGLATKLVVTPGYAGLRPTLTQALALTATDANSNPVPTTGAVFVSRTPAVATVNSGTGLVTGVAGGTAVIVATLGSVSDSMTVAVGANGSVVASAVPDTRAFDARVVGDTVRVLVAVDLRGVSPELLGSYNAELDWNTAVLRYVRTTAVGGGFAAPTLNESLTGSGQLRFDAADANGNAGPTVGLVQVVFVANAAGATTLSFTPSEIWAAGTFNNLLPAALVYGGTVRVQ
jgi:hypothetical protein